jgi:hypothetical protein
VALRPTHLLPPKRLLTPRSASRLSATNRGLLLGSPAITQVGLAPTGLVQLPGRTMQPRLRRRSLRVIVVLLQARQAEPQRVVGNDGPAGAAGLTECGVSGGTMATEPARTIADSHRR